MMNRTYRYFEGEPLFPFGYGLYVTQLYCDYYVNSHDLHLLTLCRSYTTFKYSNLTVSPSVIKASQNVSVEVIVENTGNRLSDEVCAIILRLRDTVS
jgi:beta-glucosidase